MTDFKNLNERTDEFRFAKGGRSCVLQFRELINNYFRRLAQEAEQAQKPQNPG